MIPPTPKHLDRSERRTRIEAIQKISFASIIERDKAQVETEAQRTDAARQFNGGE